MCLLSSIARVESERDKSIQNFEQQSGPVDEMYYPQYVQFTKKRKEMSLAALDKITKIINRHKCISMTVIALIGLIAIIAVVLKMYADYFDQQKLLNTPCIRV